MVHYTVIILRIKGILVKRAWGFSQSFLGSSLTLCVRISSAGEIDQEFSETSLVTRSNGVVIRNCGRRNDEIVQPYRLSHRLPDYPQFASNRVESYGIPLAAEALTSEKSKAVDRTLTMPRIQSPGINGVSHGDTFLGRSHIRGTDNDLFLSHELRLSGARNFNLFCFGSVTVGQLQDFVAKQTTICIYDERRAENEVSRWRSRLCGYCPNAVPPTALFSPRLKTPPTDGDWGVPAFLDCSPSNSPLASPR